MNSKGNMLLGSKQLEAYEEHLLKCDQCRKADLLTAPWQLCGDGNELLNDWRATLNLALVSSRCPKCHRYSCLCF